MTNVTPNHYYRRRPPPGRPQAAGPGRGSKPAGTHAFQFNSRYLNV